MDPVLIRLLLNCDAAVDHDLDEFEDGDLDRGRARFRAHLYSDRGLEILARQQGQPGPVQA
jgi:hypothetical protein